jgi:hypothetical protein
MDGKVRYASDSCLAASPAGGRINSLGMSHCPMGTVPLRCLPTGKNAQNTIVGQERRESGTRYPTVSYPIPVFRYLPG